MVHGPYRRSRRAPTITAVLPRQLASSCPRDSRCQVRLAADDMLFTRNGAQSAFAVHDTERLFES
ncbi:hypothetical protein ACFVWT_08445 [Arthrobacter sp. NPDC058288]|uniref:hypothetical protein n=1 Tax=Arthrobacter sp. NPDC058288 TaxID=3346424 RepID=UPI0036E0FEBA